MMISSIQLNLGMLAECMHPALPSQPGLTSTLKISTHCILLSFGFLYGTLGTDWGMHRAAC